MLNCLNGPLKRQVLGQLPVLKPPKHSLLITIIIKLCLKQEKMSQSLVYMWDLK